MWNPFRTLTEGDRQRIRRLERDLEEIGSDLTITSERVVRLEARLRGRARRALVDAEEGDERAPPPLQPQQPELTLSGDSDRAQTREQLRSIARSQGLVPTPGGRSP